MNIVPHICLENFIRSSPDQLLDEVTRMINEKSLRSRLYDSSVIRECNREFEKTDKATLVFKANLALREAVSQSLKENRKTFNIGGDHSMGLGTVSAFLEMYPEDSRVVWIDAHADMNTRGSSPSGNFHGMPLSFIFGWDEDEHFPVSNKLKTEHITYFGVRDVDEFESKMISEHHINLLSPKDILEADSTKIRQWVRDYIGVGKTVHISWDVDSTDPLTEIGATGTRADNGIGCHHVKDIIDAITELNHVVSMDVTELNLALAKSDEERQRSFDKTLDVMKSFLKDQ